MTKTIILFADAYYPLTVAGAHRPAKLAKYLPHFGWTPIVVCRRWTAANGAGLVDPELSARDACETYRIPHAGLSMRLHHRILRGLEERGWPYQAPRLLARAMVQCGKRLLKERRPDALWSSFMPGFVHSVASRLSRQRGLPWIADFRDLPDQSGSDGRARRMVEAEVRACGPAAALSVTSSRLALRLRARHMQPVHVIPNGFDDDDFPRRGPAPQAHFVIAYFGIFYGFRNPRALFEALDRLADEGSVDLELIRVRFYGPSMEEVASAAEGCRSARTIELLPRLGHRSALELQRDTSVLLNLQSAEAGGAVPSKLMEYLGARRPILNCPGDDGPGDEIVAETNAGVTCRDVAEMLPCLRVWFREWKRSGIVSWPGDEVATSRYSRRAQARELARILDGLLERKPRQSGTGIDQ